MQATTRGAILRGTTTDALGDENDANAGSPVAGYEDLPLSLVETSRRVQDPATGIWRTVRYYAGRLPGDVQLRDGDRVRDNRTGRVYSIDVRSSMPRGLSGRSSLTLSMRHTSG